MNALTIRPLDALARRINEEQHQIEHHAIGLLLKAKAAGDLLIEAKKQLAHGQFQQWVEANTKVSYAQASKYMRVSRHWVEFKGVADDTFAGLSIEAFLGYAKHPKQATASNLPTFTEDDAEYALKIAARMDSEFEGERDVAKAKLEKLAADHGMTGDELVAKSKALRPAEHLTDTEKELNGLREEIARRDSILADMKERFSSATKAELIELIAEWKATGKLKD